MNPLQRRLFRLQQPGMSRQPMGILASSPELMTAAQRAMAQGQPMQAATGASVNLNDSITNQLMAIQQLRGMGDRATLNNIATDKRLPRSVQMAAANALAGIEAKPDEPSQQVPLAPLDKQGSLASGTPVMSVRGSGKDVPLDVGVSADQVPVSSIPEGGVGSLTEAQVDPMTRIGSSMSTDMLNRIRKARGLEPISDTVSDSLVGAASAALPEGTLTLDALAANQAETQRLMKEDVPTGIDGGLAAAAAEAAADDKAPATEAPATGSKEKEDKTPDPVTAAENLMGTEADAQFMQISETLGDKDKTNKQKADATDAALGIKGTRKERVEQRYEMLKDLLGEDKADDIRTDVGYNLMMTGLMIAAGQSPDAMTNIAGGLAKGLAGYGKAAGEAAQAEAKEEKALKLMAAKEVGAEMTAEKAAEIRAQELADERTFKKELQQERLDATREIKEMGGDTVRIVQGIADAQGISFGEAALLYKNTGSSSATDTDQLAIAYGRQYPNLTDYQARILASDSGKFISEFGSIDEAIKQLFPVAATTQGQNNKVVVDPSQLKQK
jgi:hypothetical protein